MYNILEDFEEYKLDTYTDAATFYQYYVNKYKTHITPEDVNNCYKLTTLKHLSDYARIPNPCPVTGNQGAITTDHIPTEESPSEFPASKDKMNMKTHKDSVLYLLRKVHQGLVLH